MENDTFRRKLRYSLMSPAILHRRFTALRQMKIVGVEIGKALQPLDIWDRDSVPFQRDQTLYPKLSHNAVEMHSGHGKRIGELPLRQRQHKAVVGSESNRLKSHQQLAQKMGHPPIGRSTAHIDEPLPQGALICEC